ncbi:Retrovirus-related Pol polyprotein from transposon TNT 1-94 [Glycine max]|nr:Retrovirus-related Pol polyprotein from transposon TNT 1-94 [Glycine max]
MKTKYVRRKIVKQSHFVKRKALEDERPTSINETEWTKIQRRVVSTVRLALAPEIKYNVLKEKTPKTLWEKLENIYASKSLTNRLCLEMELYQLKMEMRGDLHDHINKFNQLVSQSLNADDKLSNEEQHCCCWSQYQLDELIAALRENERMMRTENVDDEHHALVAYGGD